MKLHSKAQSNCAVTLPWALLLVLASCGDSDEGRTEAADEGQGALPAVAPFAPKADLDPRMSRTVCVMVVDGLGSADLLTTDLPILARLSSIRSLQAGATTYPFAVAPSTGGNAVLASILTGLTPKEHGVLSIHDPGRGALQPQIETLPEALIASGWVTAGSVAHAREARGIGGFEQGFATFDSPSGGEVSRDAASVVSGLRDAARGRLGTGGKLFMLATFRGPDEVRPFDEVSAERAALAAELIGERLRGPAADSVELAGLVAQLPSGPVETLKALQARFARARGSAAAQAWSRGLRDLWLVELDDAVGEVLAMLEDSERAESAHIVLVGLRGSGAKPRSGGGGPAVRASRVEVPLLHRRPGSAAPRVDPRSVSTAALASLLAESIGLAFATDGPTTAQRFALTQSLNGDVAAALAKGTGGGESIHLERYSDGQVVSHTAAGLAEEPDRSQPIVQDMLAALEHSGRPPTLVITRARTPAGDLVPVTWKMSTGGASPAGAATYRPRIRGSLPSGAPSEAGAAQSHSLELKDRNASAKLTIGDVLGNTNVVRFGDTQLSRLPALFVPNESGVPLTSEPDAPAPALRFVRDAGLTWTLTISDPSAADSPTAGADRTGAVVEALVSVWPPREVDDALDYFESSSAEVRPVGTRRDLLHIVGTAPLEVVLKKRGPEEFAVCCRIGERFLKPGEMAFDAARFLGPDGYDVIAPAWQAAPESGAEAGPGRAQGQVELADVAKALYISAPSSLGDSSTVGATTPDAAVVVQRTGFGPVPGIQAGHDFVGRERLKRMPSTE